MLLTVGPAWGALLFTVTLVSCLPARLFIVSRGKKWRKESWLSSSTQDAVARNVFNSLLTRDFCRSTPVAGSLLCKRYGTFPGSNV